VIVSHPTAQGSQQDVHVRAGQVTLAGTLAAPPEPIGVVVFAHGSGSGRFSSRNRYVADELRNGGLATLLMDLLTPDEESIDQLTRQYRFDIPRLADRLVGAIGWLAEQRMTKALPVGLFGASTGGGAALIAASREAWRVRAVVSRGGRPDLAAEALRVVGAPTLLIVGSRDEQVIALNRQAMAEMSALVRLEIVPGATHLFEEPGTLEQVARLARDWFVKYLAVTTGRR